MCVVSAQFSSVGRLLRNDAKLWLSNGPYGSYGYFSDDSEIERAFAWQEKHQNFIFLRDLLDCSVALDYNFAERGRYTDLGLAEYNAKNAGHGPSINTLVRACVRAIATISSYKNSDAICAVPPSLDKAWDLPTEIARLVSEKTGKPDISDCAQFWAVKKSIKTSSLEEKWAALNAGQLVVDKSVAGKKVILIDDKYQSGTTAQFIASKLYESGVEEVNGLFCIKTWRDTDNQ
ncbi:MAG: hypothetical protein WA417_01990 [Stellaceae bacterium]